jgi:DNA-binding SARP family transcriptional activator
MARLEIKFFGEVEAQIDGQLLRFPTQKTKELFAYLVLHHQHAHPRAALAGLLWPESDEEHAKANLRQTLSRLRQTLAGTECLRLSGGAAQFQSQDFWCDVLEFERWALTPDPSPVTPPVPSPPAGRAREGLRGGTAGVRALESALALYRGPFLSGIYEDWVLVEQERLQALYLEVLERLAELYQADCAYEEAIQVWKKALQPVPWHERAHRDLMTLHALLGNRAAALQQYNEYVETVRRELNAAPLPEMHTLYENLQKGLTVPKRTETRLSLEMPFVGRERELQILQTMWKRVCQREGQAVLIGGEIGLGKTRFVERFFQSIREEGCIVRGAAYAQGLPYEPLLQTVRQGLKEIASERLAQLPVSLLSELARFVPEIASERLEPATELPPAEGKRRLSSALTSFFELLAQERPVALFLDDLHWADSATLEYLRYLMAQLKGLRVLVLGTYRVEEAQDQSPLRRWLDELGPGRSYQPITLQRLSTEETAQALALWLGSQTPATSSWLYGQTGGNPLFMRELVHSLLHSQMLSQDEEGRWCVMASESGSAYLPESMRELIGASLRRLSERERQLVGMMSVLGRSFEFDLCREIVRQPRERLISKLERLRRVGLLIEREGRYQFHHELMRQVVYEELSADRRRLWHRQIGQRLEELYPQRLDELSAELAEHFERAQQWEKAIIYAMRAGAQARRIYSYGATRVFYAKAFALFEVLEKRKSLSRRLLREQFELCRQYLSRSVFPTIYDMKPAASELQRVLAKMLALAEALGNLEDLCETHQYQARLELALGHPQAARETMRRAFALAQRTQNAAVIADVLQGVATLSARCSEYHQAVIDQQRYVEMLVPLGDALRLGQALNELALMQRMCGAFSQAQKTLEKANEQFQQAGDLWGQAAVADNLGCILRDLGRYTEARQSLERALELNRATGDQRGIGYSLVDFGVLHNDQGHYEEALGYFDRMVALLDQPGMKGHEIETFSEKARAHLGRCEPKLASECSARAIRLLEEHQGVNEQAYRFYFTHSRILEANGQTEQARLYLQRAYERLRSIADQISDEALRRSFLENVSIHRQIIEAWQTAQQGV